MFCNILCIVACYMYFYLYIYIYIYIWHCGFEMIGRSGSKVCTSKRAFSTENGWNSGKRRTCEKNRHCSSVFFLALYAYGRQIEKYAGTMVNGGLLIVLSLRRCDCRCGAALSGVSTIWLCQHDMTFWYVRSTLKSWSNFCSRDLNAVVLKDSLTFSFVRLGPLALGWFRRTPGSPRSFINLVPSLEYGTQKWRCFPVLHCWSISDPLTS